MPAFWGVERLGERTGIAIATVCFILIVPLIFFVCSRYLNLLKNDVFFPFNCPHCEQGIKLKDLKKKKRGPRDATAEQGAPADADKPRR